jgi:hypothetical protein
LLHLQLQLVPVAGVPAAALQPLLLLPPLLLLRSVASCSLLHSNSGSLPRTMVVMNVSRLHTHILQQASGLALTVHMRCSGTSLSNLISS